MYYCEGDGVIHPDHSEWGVGTVRAVYNASTGTSSFRPIFSPEGKAAFIETGMDNVVFAYRRAASHWTGEGADPQAYIRDFVAFGVACRSFITLGWSFMCVLATGAPCDDDVGVLGRVAYTHLRAVNPALMPGSRHRVAA